jgi:hypothetical protein
MVDLLSSDILEQQFGPTEVEVLYQDNGTRIIRTLATDSRQILEMSRAVFIQSGVKKFPGTHQTVIEGMSMGKAFRADGIEFIREEQGTYRYALPAIFKRFFGSGEPATIVEVLVLAGPGKTPYATILETYSPDVRWPHQAGEPTAGQLAKVQALGEFLANQPVL